MLSYFFSLGGGGCRPGWMFPFGQGPTGLVHKITLYSYFSRCSAHMQVDIIVLTDLATLQFWSSSSLRWQDTSQTQPVPLQIHQPAVQLWQSQLRFHQADLLSRQVGATLVHQLWEVSSNNLEWNTCTKFPNWVRHASFLSMKAMLTALWTPYCVLHSCIPHLRI